VLRLDSNAGESFAVLMAGKFERALRRATTVALAGMASAGVLTVDCESALREAIDAARQTVISRANWRAVGCPHPGHAAGSGRPLPLAWELRAASCERQLQAIERAISPRLSAIFDVATGASPLSSLPRDIADAIEHAAPANGGDVDG
jgi:hypothetical protein